MVLPIGEATARKKLRLHLNKYIGELQRVKLKAIEDEREILERMLKLEHIRNSWPKLIPPQLKEKLIKNFREVTSSNALASFSCASCARELPLKDRQCKDHDELNLDVLDGPDVHWSHQGHAPPPTAFTSGPLANKLLEVHGVKDKGNSMYRLDLCTPCLKSIHRNSTPKHSLANRLYLGPVPPELSDLTMVEECMISHARAKSWIVKLQEAEASSSSPASQRSLKGHTIIYPQQPDNLASILPHPVSDTLTFICVIFVGSSRLTKGWLRNKAKLLVVRREKVYNALTWLKANNPLYREVKIDHDHLQALPEDDVLPYHVEHVSSDDAQETLVTRYDNAVESGNITAEVPEDTLEHTHFESVVIADVDTHTPHSQLRAVAVRHAKTKGRPFVKISHGANPVNEFNNVDLFPILYPTLFLYGCGGFEDGAHLKKISLKEHVKWLFSLRDKRFQMHYSFPFTVFNILQ